MLKQHVNVIDQFAISAKHSGEVKNKFIQMLSVKGLHEAMTGSLEVETQGWVLKEFSLKDATVTMAYDGDIVRCLCIKVGDEKPVSVLTSSFDLVEFTFNRWATTVLDQYIDDAIEGSGE